MTPLYTISLSLSAEHSDPFPSTLRSASLCIAKSSFNTSKIALNSTKNGVCLINFYPFIYLFSHFEKTARRNYCLHPCMTCMTHDTCASVFYAIAHHFLCIAWRRTTGTWYVYTEKSVFPLGHLFCHCLSCSEHGCQQLSSITVILLSSSLLLLLFWKGGIKRNYFHYFAVSALPLPRAVYIVRYVYDNVIT